MFLSIIIPIYNDEKYLSECLDSCLDQDLSKDEYEIICVDDGSTDGTRDILRAYSERYSNIRLMLMERHKGGRQTGLTQAQGEFVWFVDHDDLVAPNAVDDLKKAAEEHGESDRICFHTYTFFDPMTEHERKLFHEKSLQPNGDLGLPSSGIWASIYKRAFLAEHDIRPYSKYIAEAGEFWGIKPFPVWGNDTIFTDEFSEYGKITCRLSGRPLYLYRKTESSQMNDLSDEAKEERNTRQFNRALFEAFLALRKRERCEAERVSLGAATGPATAEMIVKIRASALRLATLPGPQWKEGLRLLSEKSVFCRRRPKEYDFSLRRYLKRISLRTRWYPTMIAKYYAYTKRGAKIYRMLTWFSRSTKFSDKLVQRVRDYRKKTHLNKER